MADEQEAAVILEGEELKRWHAIVHHPNWDETVQVMATERMRDANLICVDFRKPDEERRAAGMLFAAWAEMANMKPNVVRAYEEMVTAEQDDEAEDVGPKSEEQWYEQRS
jgi:hypothetical protein